MEKLNSKKAADVKTLHDAIAANPKAPVMVVSFATVFKTLIPDTNTDNHGNDEDPNSQWTTT